ncbi:MAG TPA: DinB family protein [Pyrinomonadaceae bacterium]
MKTTFHNVAEIFEALDESRARLDTTLAGLGVEHEALRDAPERWCVAEVVEHVAIIEKLMSQLVGRLLAKAEADGAPPPGADAGPLVALDEVAERARREKYQAPEMAVPRSGASVSDSLATLRESRAALTALRPRVEAVGASVHTYPHPAFGPLNLYQWLAFVALHEDRHRRQIERLLATSA